MHMNIAMMHNIMRIMVVMNIIVKMHIDACQYDYYYDAYNYAQYCCYAGYCYAAY